MNKIMSILRKVRQYSMAAWLISLHDLKAVCEGMSVFMRLQLIRKIVVIQPLMTIIPQLNGSSVYIDIPFNVRPAVMVR